MEHANQISRYKHPRKSQMLLNEVYFWTNTVKDWNHLFLSERYKMIVINTLLELAKKRLIKVYGFVIMPNHLHIIWELLSRNGKEMPHASFNKAVSHEIIKDLKQRSSDLIQSYEVIEKGRKYRVWQRDPLAIKMYSKQETEQKLEYIHNNPLQERWSLVANPEDYTWSSASYYEKDFDQFGFLTHYMERCG
jgi:REP element-mobilizing transposase RayT